MTAEDVQTTKAENKMLKAELASLKLKFERTRRKKNSDTPNFADCVPGEIFITAV